MGLHPLAMRRRDIVALRVLTPRGVRIAGVIRILGFSALFSSFVGAVTGRSLTCCKERQRL